MARILGCPLCGSEKLEGKQCPSCHDMTDEQWGVLEAKQAFAADRITVEELEHQLEQAFANPPKRVHDHIVYR